MDISQIFDIGDTNAGRGVVAEARRRGLRHEEDFNWLPPSRHKSHPFENNIALTIFTERLINEQFIVTNKGFNQIKFYINH